MIIKTPDDGTFGAEELLSSVHQEVTVLRQQVKELINKLERGEELDEKDTNGKVTRLRGVTDLCHKLEYQLADCRRKYGPHGFAIDFDEARREIGCSLARLAECRPEGEVPR
ncbi:MAG: hypothetical protein AAFO57_09710 [Pseudomonadota bacterium]